MPTAKIRSVVVVDSQSLDARTWLYKLADGRGVPFDSWEPGDHVQLRHPFDGVWRPYSLAGRVGECAYTVVIRPGAGSCMRNLSVGQKLRLRGPFGNFRLVPAQRYRFIAAGIGITAILPMVEHVSQDPRVLSWQLKLVIRSAGDSPLAARLAQLGAASNGRVDVVLTEVSGRPSPTSLVCGADDALVYACGPEGLMEGLRQVMDGDARRLKTESFSSAGPTDLVRHHDVSVVLIRSARTLAWTPRETLLEVLQDAGLNPVFGCRRGTCGACRVPIVEGNVEHRDQVAHQRLIAGRRHLMACVSECASTRLVLDL